MEFVLEEAAQPTPVRAENVKGLLSATVHLTDDGSRTLCGRSGRLVEADGEGATCKRCTTAVTSTSRIKRLFR